MAQDRRSPHRSPGSGGQRHGFRSADERSRGGGRQDHDGPRPRRGAGSFGRDSRGARDSWDRGSRDFRDPRPTRGRDERPAGRSYRDDGRDQHSYRDNDRDQRSYRYDDRPRSRSYRDNDRDQRSYRDDGRDQRSYRDDDRRGASGREGYRPRGRQEREGRTDARSGPYGRRQTGRDSRPPQRNRVPEPPLPADVTADQLEASARRELRALGRQNAERVARHLVMVQRLLDTDPEAAYQHARYAASHAGRVAVVREATAIAAYLSDHHADAIREIRAARRLSGIDLHHAIEADCERALGRYHQALKAAAAADPDQLDDVEEGEIAMVVSSIRHEMGQSDLGLIVIEDAIRLFRGDRKTLQRMHAVRADRLEELGRGQEAESIRERLGLTRPEPAQDVEVYDIQEESEEEARAAQEGEEGATRDNDPGEDQDVDGGEHLDQEDRGRARGGGEGWQA
ncbi:hypothetical protein [uncultured Actinomyces sp.]|uniref:hypothetical protein n=1 Tax=uncultured Actinomyces sp. TaxID=249061 RepID=UPI00345DF4A9